MNKDKNLSLNATILIPFKDEGGIDEIKDSMHEGMEKVETQMRNDYPELSEMQLQNCLKNIVLTNWAISILASKK